MIRHHRWIVFWTLAGALASCAGDSSLPRDLGAGPEASQQDLASTADWSASDQGTAGTACGEVLDCVAGCDTKACGEGCIAAGSPHAQELVVDLLGCQEAARGGTCKEQCPTASSECFACVNRVCASETHACLFGNPYPGFGDRCDDQSPCGENLTCAGQQSTGQGYCTYSCETFDELCLGAPAETYSACITSIGDGTGYVCGFICKMNLTTYKCPAPQVCSTEEAPPAGSGVYLCVAP